MKKKKKKREPEQKIGKIAREGRQLRLRLSEIKTEEEHQNP